MYSCSEPQATHDRGRPALAGQLRGDFVNRDRLGCRDHPGECRVLLQRNTERLRNANVADGLTTARSFTWGICERISSSRWDGVIMASSSWAGGAPLMRRPLRSILPSGPGLAGQSGARGSRSRISSCRPSQHTRVSGSHRQSERGRLWPDRQRIQLYARKRRTYAK